MNFAIRKKVLTTFVVMLVVISAMATISFTHIRRISASLAQLVSVEDARQDALVELKIKVREAARQVGAYVENQSTEARPKISAFKGRTRNFVIPNVICRAGSSFAAASRGLILGFAYLETYSLCFNVSSGLFFVCADSPPVLFTPADLLGPLPGRHRSQPFPGAEKISHPFVPA